MGVTVVTVENILKAKKERVHECVVATTAPALVFVLELDETPRLEVLAETKGESLALQERVRSDERWLDLLDHFRELTLEDDLDRNPRH
jgi:hypothetical protein